MPHYPAPHYATIATTMLRVDISYQRDKIQPFINALSKNYNPNFAGTILVVKRSDGYYYIVDGQHRFLAAVLAGYTEMPCQIIDLPNVADEALAFLDINNFRRSVNNFIKLKAGVTGQQPVQTDIYNAINGAGLTLVKGVRKGSTTDFAAVKALEYLYRRGEIELVDDTLDFIGRVWKTYNDRFVKGVGMFLLCYGNKFTWGQLTSVFRKALADGETPARIIAGVPAVGVAKRINSSNSPIDVATYLIGLANVSTGRRTRYITEAPKTYLPPT
jgi:hypothetical protein